jgi:hypothetical protein
VRIGQPGVADLIKGLTKYAKKELRMRGLRVEGGYSESRLAVWREVLQDFAEHLPMSHELLSNVQREYDGCINALLAEVQGAERRFADVWRQQQLAVADAAAAREDLQRQISHAVAAVEARHASAAAKKQAALASTPPTRPLLNAESVLWSISQLTDPQREDCLRRAVDAMADGKRRTLFLRGMRKMAPAERSDTIAQLLQPSRRVESGVDEAEERSPTNWGDTSDGDALAIESLLDAMPERLRAQLGARAFLSISAVAREQVLGEIRPPAPPAAPPPTVPPLDQQGQPALL